MKQAIAILFISSLCLVGCSGGTPSTAANKSQTPNVRIFPMPFQKVWKATLDTVQFDFLMGIELQDVNKGFFSTEMIRDYQPFQKRRFRLSGTITFDGQGTIVKLYKHEEVLTDNNNNNNWQAIPSDSSMENQILQKISQKLK